MRLVKLQIENYKCVESSGRFEVDQVTCLLGKNEAGKSAILEALHKLNPLPDEGTEFDVELEPPRRVMTAPGGGSDWKKVNVVASEWELDDADVARLEKLFGENVLSSRRVTVSKGYDNRQYWDVSVDEKELVRNLVLRSALPTDEKPLLREKVSLAALVSDLEEQGEGRSPKAQEFLDKLRERFGAEPDPEKVIIKSLRLPYFLYFKDYDSLPGRVSVDDYLAKKAKEQETPLSKGYRIFEALMALAETSAEHLKETKSIDALNSRLERVQNHLTAAMFEYWSQNKHLSMICRLQPALDLDQEKGWVFNVSVYNNRHKASVSLQQRSTGFIWFFSFLAWFSHLQKLHGKDIVILLDEPGLTLHGRAQQDLLRYINTELRPNHQVLYTTHSPFSIDMNNIFSLRTVEDVVENPGTPKERVMGTKVSDRVFSRDRDTLLPLEGICGWDVAQTMFIGPNVLVVEGPSEAGYIHLFSRWLAEEGREALDVRWAVCPAEGAGNIPAFVSLFCGRRLNIAVLMDYHEGQKKKVDQLTESDLLPPGSVLKTTAFAGTDESDIEDLLGRDLYIAVVNEAYGLSRAHRISETKPERAPGRVVKEVEAHFRTVATTADNFDHYEAVRHLQGLSLDQAKALPGFEAAADRFEALFKAVNELM